MRIIPVHPSLLPEPPETVPATGARDASPRRTLGRKIPPTRRTLGRKIPPTRRTLMPRARY